MTIAHLSRAWLIGEIVRRSELRETPAGAPIADFDLEIRRVEAGQTPDKMRVIYEKFRSHPQVRWKDSYQKILGIDAMGRPA